MALTLCFISGLHVVDDLFENYVTTVPLVTSLLTAAKLLAIS